MKKIIRPFLLLMLFGLFAYTLWFLYSKSLEKPLVAITETPFKSSIIRKTVATGTVSPREEVTVKPNISGIVEEVLVEPGRFVKPGDVLAKVRVVPNIQELANAENRLNRAKIGLENARLDFERNERLFQQKVISQADFQPFELALKNAREELKASEENIEIIKKGFSERTAAAANTMVRSTAGGMILDVPIKAGNSVIMANNFNEGTTIATLADMRDMIFVGKVDESEVGKLRTGMPLILNIGAIENKTFDALLSYIAPKGVEENGAVKFEIKADLKLDTADFIRAGYSANADIVLDRADSVLVINEKLLQFEKGKTFVEVETGPQVFEKRWIETGLSDGINTEVKAGLNFTDKLKAEMVSPEELENRKLEGGLGTVGQGRRVGRLTK
jgi:HlyD family secretion protein